MEKVLSKLDRLIDYIDTIPCSPTQLTNIDHPNNTTPTPPTLTNDDICINCNKNHTSNSPDPTVLTHPIQTNPSNPSNPTTPRRPRKLDIHCHILPRHIPNFREQFGYGGFIRLEHDPTKPQFAQMWQDDTFFREIDEKCFSPEARIKDMDNEGVNVQVLSTVPVMFSYWAQPEHTLIVSKFLNNDLYKSIQKYPTRFVGLGTLPMNAPKLAVEELRRCINELGFVGIMIGSNINNKNLDNEEYDIIWKECELLDIMIFIHPWNMMGKKDISKYWLPWLVSMPAETSRAICNLMFGGIFKKYPKLRFCFAHNGGSFAHTIGRIEHGYNCRPDLIQININGEENNPKKYCGHFWVDSLVHDKTALMYSLSVFGKDKIVLGTDYPFPLGECYPLKECGQLVEKECDDIKDKDGKQVMTFDMKEKILWRNGLDLINRDEKHFGF